MTLIPRSSLFDIDRFFDHRWSPFQTEEGNASALVPRVDVSEGDKGYQISAELPGVKKDDVTVTLHNGVLSIKAESHQEDKDEKNGKVIRQERRYGRFVRSFDLGPQVQDSDITASFENGILKLAIPKVEPSTPKAKRIEIK